MWGNSQMGGGHPHSHYLMSFLVCRHHCEVLKPQIPNSTLRRTILQRHGGMKEKWLENGELPHKDWHEGAIKRHIVKRQYIVHKRYSPHQSWDIVVSSYQYLLSLSFVRSQLSDLDFCVIKLDWVGAVWHNLWRYRGIQKIIKSYRWAQI